MGQNSSLMGVNRGNVVKSGASYPQSTNRLASSFEQRLNDYYFSGCIPSLDAARLVHGGQVITTPVFLSRLRMIYNRCKSCNNCTDDLCFMKLATMSLEDIDKNNIAPATAISQVENWMASKGIRI